MKHNDARNSLHCRVMILREKDLHLASGITQLLVDVHLTLGRVRAVDLLGIKRG